MGNICLLRNTDNDEVFSFAQNIAAPYFRFLREHRSEWADSGVDSYSAASLRANTFVVPGLTVSGGFLGSHVIIPLAQTVENEEVLEAVRLESHGFIQEDVLSRDMYLLQLCSGIDESAIGACAQLVFAPIDDSFADDAFLLPSGFREPPLSATRTLDLASALDIGGGSTGRAASDALSNTGNSRSVLTIAFQFTFENHLRENVAAMARQYMRSVAASVQWVAMAISLSRVGAQLRPKQHKLLYC
ncbi:Homeobox-leucine zipper protein HOX32 [Platanthera guangdongensis]|uniref:Homeobox-leucine zipper protein HOX32 n=1 Tax=Platanthera guangdongensis TaxID=2320717 RepID=A0ABR2MCF2_9ASPA